MINTPDYRQATNAAYDLITQQPTLELPISLNSILHQNHSTIRLSTYSQTAARFSLTVNEYKNIVPSEYGFTKRTGEKSYILYNDEKGYLTNRFTIAHEIGHIVLGHRIDNSVARREANCFARNLLCPAPLVEFLNVNTIDDYMNYFHISDVMAEYCIKNYPSDLYYIERHYYGQLEDLLYTFMTGESLASAYGYNC